MALARFWIASPEVGISREMQHVEARVVSSGTQYDLLTNAPNWWNPQKRWGCFISEITLWMGAPYPAVVTDKGELITLLGCGRLIMMVEPLT